MRYLCLDLGERRVGIAVSDVLGMLARPLEVFQRASRVEDFAHIAEVAQAHNVGAIIVGLPIQMDGTEGRQATWVRDYSQALAQVVALPIHFWDERLTTEEAKEIMYAQGKVPDKNWIDAVAAAVILQSYLDANDKTLQN